MKHSGLEVAKYVTLAQQKDISGRREFSQFHAENILDSHLRANSETKIHENTTFPGADVPAGLKRLAVSQEWYQQILTKFAKENHTTWELIEDAFDSGDFDKAQRLNHTLKRVSGNGRFNTFFEVCRGLDSALKSNDLNPFYNLKNLGRIAIEEVINDIVKALVENENL